MQQKNLPANLNGTVTRFKGDGRRLGYPTANINSNTKLTDGVYFGYADLDKFKHSPALIFVGTPVTTGQSGRRVEAHLLDIPDKDYYDQELNLKIEHFHRPNKKLDSLKELIELMNSDKTAAQAWFKN